MHFGQKDENRSESLISKRFVWTKPCLQAMYKERSGDKNK